MKYRTRIQYTETDKALMWERWRQGESLHAIARLFDRCHSVIGGILSRTGGIRPPPRRRSHLALALAEREEISRGVMAGLSVRTIAGSLGRAPCTVSREIRRNGGRRAYRASEADQAAWHRATRPKRCKLAQNPALARVVADKLQLEWSPHQVAGWLKRTYPDDETRQVSHETIYRTLFIQARGALKKELLQHLRRTRGMRRSRHHTQKTRRPWPDHRDGVDPRTSGRGQGPGGAWPLGGRPVLRQQQQPDRHPGGAPDALPHARASGGKDTETVVNALIKQAHKLPRELYKSLTWDRGKEMADHQRFSLATDVKVYFCDPQQPWQRGSNENTNGLLRQYFPKGMDLSGINQNRLNAVARRLNERPRETLNFETPAERFSQCVASIG